MSIIDNVLDGQVVILPQHLQQINHFQRLTKIIFTSIQRKCGVDIRNKVEEMGIEYIHTVLNSKQLIAVYNQVRGRIKSYLPTVMIDIAHSLGLQHFYVHQNSLARFIVPLEYLDDSFKGLMGRLYPYKGAHQDSSQQVPLNAINFWIAIGQIKKDNGLEIYPDVWGSTLPHDGLDISKDVDIGEPVGYDLDPGDIIVFHSNHAHGSAQNITDQTRVALTSRICIDKPTGINKKAIQRMWKEHV